MQKAQASLEYLLVLSGIMAMLLLIFPGISIAVKAVLFAVDSANAKSFSSELQSAVNEMQFLSNGTARKITAHPIGSWRFSSAGKTLSITLLGEGVEKVFSVLLPNELQADFIVSVQTTFFIKKENNIVLIEND